MKKIMNDLAEELEETFRAYYKGILSLLEEFSKKNNVLEHSHLALKNFLNNLPGDKQKAQAVLGIYGEITEDKDRYLFIAYNKQAIPKEALAIIVERILGSGSPFYHSLIEGIILQGIYSLGNGRKVVPQKQLEEEWNLDALSIIFEALEKAERFYYENEEAFKNKGQSYKLDYGATAQSFQDKISQRIDKSYGYDTISQIISKVSTTNTRHGTIRRFLYGIQMRIASHISIDDRRDLLFKVMHHYPSMLSSYNRSKIGVVFQSFVMKNKDQKGMVEDLRSALKKLYAEQYITEESLMETLSILPAESPAL